MCAGSIVLVVLCLGAHVRIAGMPIRSFSFHVQRGTFCFALVPGCAVGLFAVHGLQLGQRDGKVEHNLFAFKGAAANIGFSSFPKT